jgi:S1-C subfamily serine protease
MPIRLTAIAGPLEGQSFEYGKGKGSITIGRLEDRDIRFPADFRSISRAHLTIVMENDKYYLRPDEAVYVDGQEAMRDDELPKRCELRLGSPTGPGFRVEWNILSDMPSTQPPVKRAPRQSPAREAMRATARVKRIAVAAVALVLLVAAGAVAYVWTQPEPLRERLAAARPSVYLVVLRNDAGFEESYGTAWVIRPGVLATNAHVVAGIEKQQKEGIKAAVRSSVAPYDTHDIVRLEKHPHYERFTNLVKQYAPVAPGGRLVESTTGYDVGLIYVSPNAKLAPPLKLADTATLHKLAAGDEVGYVGYPSEGMVAGGVNVAAPTPQTHIGTISAMTDFFLAEGEVGERQLIQHSLTGAGGASGSPIFNRRGEVIGLFNAGNLIRVGDARVPTIQVFFAQRADLVAEILGVQIEKIAMARDELWKKRLAGLPSAPEYLVQRFQESTSSKGEKPTLETTVKLAQKPNIKNPVAMVDFEIPGPGKMLVLAVGEEPETVHLYVLDPANDNRVLARKTDAIHYPWINHDPENAGKVTLAVLGANLDRKVLLRVYFVPKKS